MYYYSLGTWRGPVLSMKPMGSWADEKRIRFE